jgi:hypothetical protein
VSSNYIIVIHNFTSNYVAIEGNFGTVKRIRHITKLAMVDFL